MKTWLEPQNISLPPALQATVGGHPIVAQHLLRLGITTPDSARKFLDSAAYTPTSADVLPDIDRAVSRVQQAIQNHETILIWGDFDVDGQTSTALLVSALRDLGALVQYHIPNRFYEGHGIFLPTLKSLLDGGIELVLTCDTGIAAHEAIDYAQGRGVDVIVTDHHSLPPTLPDAYAIINPMRLPEGHALRELPGVGTAYKFVQALYGHTSTDHLLDLVALGIVADVMVQVDDTRYLLQRGLDRLRNHPREGIRAMMLRAGIVPETLTEMDIGFSLAPRLNALGRLADANPSVELLTTTDVAIITERINELEGLNQKRRFLTRQVYEAAQEQIQNDPSLLKYAALVVVGEGWHPGVVGIVASRLVEDYNCPVVILTENDGVLSGSARSVTGANIVEALRTQADLLANYGGHNMAAGLSLDADNLIPFRRGLSGVVREMIGRAEIEPELTIDNYINLSDIDLDFADDISRLAPFGNGNPPLTLATKNVHIKSRRTLGSRGDHLQLTLEDEAGNSQKVVWWFGDVEALPSGHFDIAYTVRANVFNGKREALVEWIDARPHTDAGLTISDAPQVEILDYREESLENALQQFPDALIFAEGEKIPNSVDRFHLHQSDTLLLWTMPPSPSDWQAILNLTQPQRVLVFGKYPRFASTQDFVTHLIGMAKFAQKKREGIISLDDFVRSTAQTVLTVQAGLRWIEAHAALRFVPIDEDTFTVINQTGDSPIVSTDWAQLLAQRLQETEAYRQWWLKHGL